MTTSPLPPFSPFKEEMGRMALGTPLVTVSFDPLNNTLGRMFSVMEMQYNKLREVETTSRQNAEAIQRLSESVRGIERRMGDMEAKISSSGADIKSLQTATENNQFDIDGHKEDIQKLKDEIAEIKSKEQQPSSANEDGMKKALEEFICETVDRITEQRNKNSMKKYASLLQNTQKKVYVALSALKPSKHHDETEEVAASQEGIEETEGKGSAQGMIGETDNSSLGSRPSTTTSRPMTSGSRPLTMENHSKPESPAKRIIAKQSLERQDSGLSEFLDTDLDDAEKLIAEIAQKLEDDIIETRRESIRAKQSAQGAHERVTSTNDQMKEDVTELRERIAKLEKGGSSAGADAVPSAMLSQTKAAVDDTTGRLALVEDAVAALEMALGLEEPLLKRAVSEVGDGAKKLAGMVGRLKEMNHKGNMNPVDKETLDKVVTDTAELKKFTTLSLQQQSIAIAGLRDEVYQRLDDIYAGGAAPSTSNGGVGGGRITDEEMVKRLNRLGPFLGSVALKGALDSKVSREEMMQLTRAINETRAAIVPYDDKDIVKKLGKLEKFVKEKLQGLDGMDIQMTLEILQKKIKSTGAELRREYLDTFERIKRVHKEIAGQMDTVKKRLETKAPKDDVEQLRREVFEEQAASITKTSYMCISCNRPYTKTELGPEVWERERQKQADELNSHRAAIEASTTLAARSAAGQLDREEGESSDTPRKDKKAKKQRGVVQLPFSDGLELQNSSSSNLVNASFKPEPPRGSQFKMNRPSPRGGISKESEKGLALLEKERSEQLTPRREEKGGGQSVESGLVVTLPARMVRQDTTTSSAGEDSSLPALSQTTSATTLGTPRKAAAPVDPVVAEGWPETPKTGQ